MALNNLSRGGLVRAKIINLTTNEEVQCMFNPNEYTLTKRNTWTTTPAVGANTPQVTFQQGGSQSLRLTLHFDSLMDDTDVRNYTDPLWKMMMVDERNRNPESDTAAPPECAVSWGRLYFRAVLTSMTQKFTMFKPDGTPVRCQVDVTFEQKIDTLDDYDDSFIPVRAADAQREVSAVLGDRVDNIVSSANNSSKIPDIRSVMEDNGIDDPLNIAPGSTLRINSR